MFAQVMGEKSKKQNFCKLLLQKLDLVEHIILFSELRQVI